MRYESKRAQDDSGHPPATLSARDATRLSPLPAADARIPGRPSHPKGRARAEAAPRKRGVSVVTACYLEMERGGLHVTCCLLRHAGTSLSRGSTVGRSLRASWRFRAFTPSSLRRGPQASPLPPLRPPRPQPQECLFVWRSSHPGRRPGVAGLLKAKLVPKLEMGGTYPAPCGLPSSSRTRGLCPARLS